MSSGSEEGSYLRLMDFCGPASGCLILSVVQVQKKKILLAVLPDLKTDAACVATWQGKTLMTSAGPLKVPHSFFLFFINLEPRVE